MIQGLLTTHQDQHWIEYTFKELFKLVENHAFTGQQSFQETSFPTNANSAESTIHACNILRVLYRDSSLGDVVLPFVAEGVIIAINGFKSCLWPVRNSATLLFSALMTRIFGVKKSKNELSKKNLMSSRAFFLRFPVLYNFLLKEITIVAEKLQTPSSSSDLQEKNCFDH